MERTPNIISIPYYQLRIQEEAVSYRYLYGEAYLSEIVPLIQMPALITTSREDLLEYPFPGSIKPSPYDKHQYLERLQTAIAEILEIESEEPQPLFDVGGFKGLLKMLFSNLFSGSKARAKPKATPYLEKRLALGYLIDVLGITRKDVYITIERQFWKPIRITVSKKDNMYKIKSIERYISEKWVPDRLFERVVLNNEKAHARILSILPLAPKK